MNIITLPIGMLQTNCYFLCDEQTRQCAIIDPAAVGEKLLARASSEGYEVAAIFLTHAHFDHTGGLKAIHAARPELPIYVHATDTDEKTNMSHGHLVYTHTYGEGDVLSVGNLSVTVLHTPGHTLGSVCLRCEDSLFAGDTLFEGSCGRVDFPGGDGRTMMASLKRLAELPGDARVFSGHGDATTLQAERLNNPYVKEAMCR